MKITTTHDRLREGDFPIDEIQSIDPNITITINQKNSVFKQEIIIEFNNDSDKTDIDVAFKLGQLVGVLKANKNK